MGLINKTHKEYYKGSELGNYQFTSLDDIITQFQIAYVGEDKIISKIKRADIAFHAQRAMQELSFDTFKSIKSQQIDLANTLQMALPHDYVNYTKVSWTDGSGIKHPLYSTKHTSNPFQVRQTSDDEYYFESGENLLTNGDFSVDNNVAAWGWTNHGGNPSGSFHSIRTTATLKQYVNYIDDEIKRENEALAFKHLFQTHGGYGSHAYCVYQKVDVRGIRAINLKATGDSAAQQTDSTAGDIADYGVVRVGLTTTDPMTGLKVDGSIGWARPPGSINNANPPVDLSGTAIDASYTKPFHPFHPSPQYNPDSLDLDYLEWNDGTSSEKELEDVNVDSYDFVWVCIVSFVPFTSSAATTVTGIGTTSITCVTNCPTSISSGSKWQTKSTNTVDEISVTTADTPNNLQHANTGGDSDTWNNYKSTTPSENNSDDYQDDTYWPVGGERYGLNPQHAQVNGSFFIDDRLGKIHFSSNISGKTVILDYISDSLGTDEEMKVHKFAEEAMYKSILCAIMSAKANVGRNQLMYYKKDKFAAIRQAKLRLSNIKLEELTQILRGKSKHIKH